MEFFDLFKVIGVGILTLIAFVTIKPIKPEFAIFISIVGSCIILMLCLKPLNNVLEAIGTIVMKTGLNNGLISSILKIVGVGYLVEFAAGLCVDAGNVSISEKILFAGKICILALSLPLIINLLDLVVGLLP